MKMTGLRIVTAKILAAALVFNSVLFPAAQALPAFAAVQGTEASWADSDREAKPGFSGSSAGEAKPEADQSVTDQKAAATASPSSAVKDTDKGGTSGGGSGSGKKATASDAEPKYDEDGYLIDGDVLDDVSDAEDKEAEVKAGEKRDQEEVLKDGGLKNSRFEDLDIEELEDSVEAEEWAGDPSLIPDWDPEEMLRRYLERQLLEDDKSASGRKLMKAPRGDGFTGNDATAYDYIKEQVEKVAAGELDSSEFFVPLTLFGISEDLTVDEEDLGLERPLVYVDESGPHLDAEMKAQAYAIMDEWIAYDGTAIFRALLADCPYELYWANKEYNGVTVGKGMSYGTVGGEPYVNIYYKADHTVFRFVTAEDFRTESGGEYSVDTEKTGAASQAADKAKEIVQEAADMSDYEKLVYYRNQICTLTSYNSAAAAAGSSGYGGISPWQVIYVFDEDPDTNVVCEGYSKAFKYLCDMTEFEDSLISCSIPTGTMQGGTGEGGGHMWNVVTMDDGMNYLVDVTNCDTGTVGAPDQLFLKGYTSGSYAAGYRIKTRSGSQLLYTYDSGTKGIYSEEELTLADIDYDPNSNYADRLYWGVNGLKELRISTRPLPAEYTGGIFYKTDVFAASSQVPWSTSINSAVIGGTDDIVKPVSTAYWFYNRQAMVSVDLSGLDTSEVTTMKGMFRYCSQLGSLDVSHFDTSNVEDMSYMFYCPNITELDLSNFNTSSVRNMGYMFNCSRLTSLDVSSFDTSEVNDMQYMFSGCSSLTKLDLGSFTSRAVGSTAYMFSGCSKLETIYLDSFTHTPQLTRMFAGCTKLKTIYSHDWQVYNNSNEVFLNCTSLVGGAGTVYDESRTSALYARLDGGSESPGYFTEPKIRVTDISLDQNTLSLAPGETAGLTVTILPDEATDPSVIWTSSDETVATVDADGIVTAVADGTALITATAADDSNGVKSASCEVTVQTPYVPVSGIALVEDSLILQEGTTRKLTALISPGNASNQEVIWSSNNTAVATVASDGTVTAVSSGTATITATAADDPNGDKSASCEVLVTIPVSGAALDNTELRLAAGTTHQIGLILDPENAVVKSTAWSSDNETVVSVTSDGVVEAHQEGQATITVSVTDEMDRTYSASCAVTAFVAVTGISLDQETLTLETGKTKKLVAAVSPDDATDKEVIWSSNNTAVATVASDGTVTAVAAGTATITATAADDTNSVQSASCEVTVKDPVVNVTGVKLSATAIDLEVDKTQKLTATVSPANATNKAVTWRTSNASVATVASDGTVKAVKAGTATITVTAKDTAGGTKTATCKVTVKDPVVNVTGVKLNTTAATIPVTKTQKLTATVSPANATNKAMTWKSSNQTVATVASDGTVKAIKAGTATITVTSKDTAGGIKTAACKVTVPVPVSSVKLNTSAVTLAAGKTQKLTATVLPANAANKAVTWKSSNTAVATVASDGTVKAVKAGTATITVTSKDTAGGIKTAACKVTVPVPVSRVKLNTSGLSLIAGKTQKLTATVLPTNAANKAVTWKSSNQAVATVASDGTVKAVKAGTATITVTTKDGAKTAKCIVIVKNANGWVVENGKKYYYTNGAAAKGWKTISGNIYYFDTTGAMVTGEKIIDNIPCYFNPVTGIAYGGWRTVSGNDYWYEKGKRRGTKYDPAGVYYNGTNRGCEVVAPGPDGKPAWFWLDAVYDGAKAVNKEVMMPYTFNGQDTTPKWVRYDEKGAMIKGWYYDSKNSKWVYYNPTSGAMTKGGPYTIDGKERYFNEATGALIGPK